MSEPVLFRPGSLGSLWDVIVEMQIGRLFAAVEGLRQFGQYLDLCRSKGANALFGKDDWERLEANCRMVSHVVGQLNVQETAHFAFVLHNLMIKVPAAEDNSRLLTNGPQLHGLAKAIEMLYLSFQASLQSYMCVLIDFPNTLLWLGAPFPDTEAIVEAFPQTVAEDLDEAGKCLAVRRGTAAVFHLMRAMEAGVRALGDKLGATVMNKNGEVLPWGVLVANIKTEIDKLAAGPDRDEWYKLHSMLYSVNRSFRTKTAHPVHVYTEEQARSAYEATKAFLLEMAEKLA